MSKKKTKYPANLKFMQELEKTEKTNFEVYCSKRQTSKHFVRQMSTKSSFIYEKV